MTYGTTLFTGRGDVTLAWDEPDDPRILQMIDAQMRAGVTFFVVEPRLGGMASPAKRQIASAREALPQRIVAMSLTNGDQSIIPAIESGAATPVATPDKPAKTRRKAKTAEEVAGAETIGVKAGRGG